MFPMLRSTSIRRFLHHIPYASFYFQGIKTTPYKHLDVQQQYKGDLRAVGHCKDCPTGTILTSKPMKLELEDMAHLKLAVPRIQIYQRIFSVRAQERYPELTLGKNRLQPKTKVRRSSQKKARVAGRIFQFSFESVLVNITYICCPLSNMNISPPIACSVSAEILDAEVCSTEGLAGVEAVLPCRGQAILPALRGEC